MKSHLSCIHPHICIQPEIFRNFMVQQYRTSTWFILLMILLHIDTYHKNSLTPWWVVLTNYNAHIHWRQLCYPDDASVGDLLWVDIWAVWLIHYIYYAHVVLVLNIFPSLQLQNALICCCRGVVYMYRSEAVAMFCDLDV